MIIADAIKPKSTLMARKHVSHLHKTCVKPSCATFTSQVTSELCRLAAESLFLTVYTVLFGVATGFLCQLLFSHSLSSSYFRIMIVPGKTKTYWFSYRWWRKRGAMGANIQLSVKSCIFQMGFVAKYLSEWVSKHTGGFSSTWTWMAFTVRSKVSISSQPTSFSTKPLEQRPCSSSDPKIFFLSKKLSEKH